MLSRRKSLATFFHLQQVRTLVNVKLKWVKDSVLDKAVDGGRELQTACTLVHLLASAQNHSMPIYHLIKHRGQLNLPPELKLSAFLRRYPNIFEQFYLPDTADTPVPHYKLSLPALEIYQEENRIFNQVCYLDVLNRLRKLLMLNNNRVLPLQTIDQVKFDLGLPYDFVDRVVLNHRDMFGIVELCDGRFGLKLLVWDGELAVSHLEMHDGGTLAFPIRFTRGYGLRKKCMEWLKEFQNLPYTSPYVHAAQDLDPRTDVSEKRNVGVFHELLHLMVAKKTERKNVSNLRKPLGLPQKFTKVFERHPGIFYISKKGDTQTVVLKEGYERDQLIERHPLVDVRQKYASMMKEGFLDRSRGLYKKNATDEGDDNDILVETSFRRRNSIIRKFESEEESDSCNLFSEYESEETKDEPC